MVGVVGVVAGVLGLSVLSRGPPIRTRKEESAFARFGTRCSRLTKMFLHLLACAAMRHRAPIMAQPSAWTVSQLVQGAKQHQVGQVMVRNAGLLVTETNHAQHFVQLLPQQVASITDLLLDNDVDLAVDLHQPLSDMLFSLVPWLLVGYFASGLLNRLPAAFPGRQEMMIASDLNVNTTFDDVAGGEGTKRELREIVEFLREPERFRRLGARIPRGVIMEGPPGTGKTLLARAIAGESECTFIPIMGSAFVEMYVGLGARRVRELFKMAREREPCIIFIDEIDAIGKKRASNPSSFGGNDEREQTLNQILSEMDGFSKTDGVIVVAATNRIDVLDDALLRPGRFDRKVSVALPDVQAREAIFGVHARDKPMDGGIDGARVARLTPAFSGAQIENVVNEAAIYAARASSPTICMEHIEEAIDRVVLGLPLPLTNSDEFQRLVAYHEAGHAIVGYLEPGYDQVGKVTILPRGGGSAGVTQFVPDDARASAGLYSLEYVEASIRVALGGRVAEEIVFGAARATTGASSDLARVRDIAYRMVTEWGFSSMGPSGVGSTDEVAIEKAVDTIISTARESVFETLVEHRSLLDRTCNLLLTQQTIRASDIARLIDQSNLPGDCLGADADRRHSATNG